MMLLIIIGLIITNLITGYFLFRYKRVLMNLETSATLLINVLTDGMKPSTKNKEENNNEP